MTNPLPNLNMLELQINQLQNRIAQLLEQEQQEKHQHQLLTKDIKQLQTFLTDNQSNKNQLEKHQRLNLEYLQKKIDNHQHTLQQYKNLYEQLQNKNCSNRKTYNNYQSGNQASVNITYMLESQQQRQDLKQSVGSFSSSLSQQQQESEGKKEISVICEFQCQNCGGVFKPYRYYSHINHCHKKSLINAQMCTSLLVD